MIPDALPRPDGVILAGGLGTRMRTDVAACVAPVDGSDQRACPPLPAASGDTVLDKAWCLLDGVPLIAHAAGRLRPQVSRLLISSHDQPDRYAPLGSPVSDACSQRLGPLAGILAALQATQSDWLAVAPCDTPFLPAGWVARLHAAACLQQAPLALAMHGGYRQPVCMVIRRDQRDGLAQLLDEGVRKVGQWQRAIGAVTVGFDDAPAHAFMNINTAVDLAQAEDLLRRCN